MTSKCKKFEENDIKYLFFCIHKKKNKLEKCQKFKEIRKNSKKMTSKLI